MQPTLVYYFGGRQTHTHASIGDAAHLYSEGDYSSVALADAASVAA